jgi:hypothetical protein
MNAGLLEMMGKRADWLCISVSRRDAHLCAADVESRARKRALVTRAMVVFDADRPVDRRIEFLRELHA